MQRTNIYLDEGTLRALKGLSQARRKPVAAMVREAIDAWLEEQGVTRVEDGEWERRFDLLLDRRRGLARSSPFSDREVERDVAAAVREARAAGRR